MHEIAEVNQQRNWHVPIIRLPVEVFSDILFGSLVGLEATSVERLRELAMVAKHWRDVVAATPGLWVMAAEGMRTKDLALTLRKSKHSRLDVIFRSQDSTEDFVAAIVPHASRWRSIRITRRGAQNISSSLSSQARLLEDIRIYKRYSPDSPASPASRLELCEGVCFRHVDLWRVALPWDTSRLAGLVSLRLEDIEGDHAPSVSQLIAIVIASPTLKSMVIVASDFVAED